MKTYKSPQLINSLDKGLKIINILHEQGKIGVTELSNILNVNKSSAYRLLATLKANGFVEQESEGGKYRLGMKIAKYQTKVLDDYELREIAHPFLVRLSVLTNQASGLAIMQGNEGLLIDKHNSPQYIGATLIVGMSEPLYCTSLGKALLCSFPEEEQIRLLKSVTLEKRTPKTMTDIPAIINMLKEATQSNITFDDEEYSLGMRCIAAQVKNYSNKVIAAIGISGPINQITSEKIDEYSVIVKQIADELSLKLGY